MVKPAWLDLILWLVILSGALEAGCALVFSRWRGAAWRPAVARVLEARLVGKRIEGALDGLAYEITLGFGLLNGTPWWRVRFPAVTGPALVLRRETNDGKRFKRVGLVKKLQVGESGFDDAHLVLCTDPESARLLFQRQEVRAAAAALELDVADRKARRRGGIDHVQLGRELSALIDVTGVSGAEVVPRIAALLVSLANLARIVAAQRLPAPSGRVGAAGRDLPAWAAWASAPGWAPAFVQYFERMLVFFRFGLPTAVLASSLAVLYSGMDVRFLYDVWRHYALGASAVAWLLCFLVIKPWVGRIQAGVIALMVAILAAATMPGVLAVANAAAGAASKTTAMTVAESKESETIGFSYRSVELEDGMKVAVDWKLGESLQKGDAVGVTRVLGVLGQARVLKLSK
jgi:hypothetical protein